MTNVSEPAAAEHGLTAHKDLGEQLLELAWVYADKQNRQVALTSANIANNVHRMSGMGFIVS